VRQSRWEQGLFAAYDTKAQDEALICIYPLYD